jgi:hemerythrin-like domain-containing protein
MSVLERMKVTLGTYNDADVRSLLHEDHKRIRELAKELAETQSAARRRTLVRELQPLLVAHSRAEEAAVYAPMMELRGSPDSRAAGSEGMVEHNLADIVLGRLVNTADTSSDMWKAHAKVLHESLEHHIREEEGELFHELGEHFSDEEREAMGVQFMRGKDKLLKQKSQNGRKQGRAPATRGREAVREDVR